MKRFKQPVASLLAATIMTGFALSFNACTEGSPLQSADNEAAVDDIALAKHNIAGGGSQDNSNYPQYVSGTVSFQPSQEQYQGCNMNVPGGSNFHLSSGALTPPSYVPFGQDVTFTMSVVKKKQQGKDVLEFTFGPHGSTFNPPAAVTFDWTDLGIDVASLYYMESPGNYVLQSPDQIDIQNKRMTIYLDHFSTYALAAE